MRPLYLSSAFAPVMRWRSSVMHVVFPRCLGDASEDGLVDVQDMTQVILEWGPCPGPPDLCPSDLNGDFVVDVQDLVEVIANWGVCNPEGL